MASTYRTSRTLVSAQQRGKGPSWWTRLWRSESFKGYLYISPWILGFLLFGIWPLLNLFYDSLTKYTLFGSPQWIGLENYVQIFTKDPVFRTACLNMLIYVIAATAIYITGGMLLALALQRHFPGNHIFRIIFYVPSLLVGVATGILFKQVFASGENGLANVFLSIFHIPAINWLQDINHPIFAVVALVLVNIWFMGGTMLIFIAGLKGISPTYYEAAQIDGASKWHIFWSVTLPLLSPVVVFNTIMALIANIQVFQTVVVFASTETSSATGGTGNPLGFHSNLATFLPYIYVQAFLYDNFGYAAALSVIVFFISLLLALIVLTSARFTYFGDQ